MKQAPGHSSDRSFRILLLLVGGAFVYMILPFATSLIIAATVVVLAWPMHIRLLKLVRGRQIVAISLSFLVLTLGMFGLVSLVIGLVVPELGQMAGELSDAVQQGAFDRLLDRLHTPAVEGWLNSISGEPADLGASLAAAARKGILTAAGGVAQSLPAMLNVTGRLVLSTLMFLVALASFLTNGPQIIDWIGRLSPLERGHTDRILSIFASFARNVVLAGTATGILQGIVAAIGFALAGVERAALFGTLTAVAAYVPFIGTTLVWLPLVALLVVQERPGAAVFVTIWSLALTGTVDNFVKPFLVRGRSHLPPLLIFLGVFGGLMWFGIIGLLIGPVLAATMTALLTIYEQEVLSRESAEDAE